MTIEEKYSRYWIQITVGLTIGTVIFFGGYNFIEDVLWEGILRLVAFCFLAAAVFSGLKVMEGKHSVQIKTEEQNLILSYYRNESIISRDVFELKNIGEIFLEPHSGFMGEHIFMNDFNIRFVPVDSDRPLNLIEVNGRPLALSSEDAEKLMKFVADRAENAILKT